MDGTAGLKTGQTRRTFIKNGILVSIAAGSMLGAYETGFAAPGKERWGMIIDLDRCIGCRSCTIACKLQNDTVEKSFSTTVFDKEIGEYPRARNSFMPVQCNHCENPPCVEVCPEDATFRLSNGIVVTDWSKCTGDGSCIEACPYGARFPDHRFGNRVDKCDFCFNRLQAGLEPACVEACPSKARLWGDLNNPEGEFSKYINTGELVCRKPELGIKTGVLYKNVPEESA